MDLIQTLEHEEIARLNKTIPPFAPGDTGDRQRQRRRRHAQAGPGVRRRRHRQAQPEPQLELHRAQDLERRGRRAHFSALQPADRLDRGQAPRRCAPGQAVLPSQAARASRPASRKSCPEARALRRFEAARRAAFFIRTPVPGLMPLSFDPEQLPVLRSDAHLPPVAAAELQLDAIAPALSGAPCLDPGDRERRPRHHPSARARGRADRPAPSPRGPVGAADAAHRAPDRPSGSDQLSGRPCRADRCRRRRHRAARGPRRDRPPSRVRQGVRRDAVVHHRHRFSS